MQNRKQNLNKITYNVVTMGCKVNTYDTSLLEKKLNSSGFHQTQGPSQVHIINSCAVTEKSSLETHRAIKKIKAHNPDSIVVVTGCVAQVDVERLTNLTGADLIIGNSHKTEFEKTVRDFVEGKNRTRVFHSNIFKKDELDPGGGVESSKTRAFLKIQDGCNSFCSFCIIPFARGKSRSLSRKHLVERVKDLQIKGFKEVVLTGVHCGDYEDEKADFASLIETVLSETQISRLRLSSLEPIELNEKLWKLFKKTDRLCPHIHVSLQSANSKVLKDMRRKYTQNDIAKFFEDFRKNIPDGFIGMDVIAGFPGETEEEFADTYAFLENQKIWSRIHVFPYSIRPGTLASKRTDQLPQNVIQARARRLRELSQERLILKAAEQIGLTKKVLVLEKPAHGAHGLSRDYWPVAFAENFDSSTLKTFKNREVEVKITGLSKPSTNGREPHLMCGPVVSVI